MSKLDYKGVGITGVQTDETTGKATAIVSVTGIKDNVNDIITPGIYGKSLAARTPKGVWQHNWHESIAKTNSIKELLPGDPELPATLPDGKPWPAEAGGLKVDMEFNMKTQRGREAFEDVRFFGDEQEWSIGYSVPVGGATIDSKTGIRTITAIELYEYSPVLFGAMSSARTSSVKDAQNAMLEMKSLFGDDADRVMMMAKSILDPDNTAGDTSELGENGSTQDNLDPVVVDNTPNQAEDQKQMGGTAVDPDAVRNAIKTLQALLVDDVAVVPTESKSLFDMLDATEADDPMLDVAEDFDEALEDGDLALAEKSALPVLSFIEATFDLEGIDEKSLDTYREIALYIGEQLGELSQKSASTEDGEEVDEEENVDDPNAEEDEDEAKTEAKATAEVIETKSVSSVVAFANWLDELD